MRAACVGLVLRGQRFANEQILRGPALVAPSVVVKGQYRLVCRGGERPLAHKTRGGPIGTEL